MKREADSSDYYYDYFTTAAPTNPPVKREADSSDNYYDSSYYYDSYYDDSDYYGYFTTAIMPSGSPPSGSVSINLVCNYLKTYLEEFILLH